jgi:hypothetical protein
MVTIDGANIERVNQTKFLGVYIDSHLSWSNHVDNVALKVARGLGAIGRARYLLPEKPLLVLYRTLILPHLMYCNVVWGAATQTILDKLVKLQKRAIRLISKSDFRSHTNPLFVRLHLLKFTDLVVFQTVLFLYQIKTGLLPSVCTNLIQFSDQNRSHNTRQTHLFAIPNYRTGIREKCITIRGPKLWEEIPIYVQSIPVLSIFKRELYNFLVTNYNI